MIEKGREVELISWSFEANDAKAVVVQFHGNGQNLSSHFRSLYWVLDHNMSLFAFDYPGYGGSEGSPNPKNTVEAGRQAILVAKQKWPHLPVIVVGQSLGGAVAMQTLIEADAELRSQIALVVIESSFDSYQKIGQAVLAKNWVTWPFQWLSYLLLSDQHAPYAKISKLAPLRLLIIHEDQDQVVPSWFAQRIFSQAAEPKAIHIFEGQSHLGSFHAGSSKEAREVFFNQLKIQGFL